MNIPVHLNSSIQKLIMLMPALEDHQLKTSLKEVIDCLQSLKAWHQGFMEEQMKRDKFPAVDEVIDALDILWILLFALDMNGHHAHENASGPLKIAIEKLTKVRKWLEKDL